MKKTPSKHELLEAMQGGTLVKLLENVNQERDNIFRKVDFLPNISEEDIGKNFEIHSVEDKFLRLKGLTVRGERKRVIDSTEVIIPFHCVEINNSLAWEETYEIYLRNRTNNGHRLSTNPAEKAILEKWLKFLDTDHREEIFSRIVLGKGSDKPMVRFVSEEEKKMVASAMQWLGSPVGISFLHQIVNIQEVKDYINRA